MEWSFTSDPAQEKTKLRTAVEESNHNTSEFDDDEFGTWARRIAWSF